MKKKINRYYILAAGMIAQLCAGIMYMWSVFREPVALHLDWNVDSASLTSSIMLATFVLGLIFGGYAQDKLGPRIVTGAGSFLIGAGMMGTAMLTGSVPWLIYLTYGVIGGFGVGTVYTSTIAAIHKWFPDRRGFASGMLVSSFGLSLVLFAPLTNSLLSRLGVPATFVILGIIFWVICGTCSFFIQNPPEGYFPDGYVPPQSNTKRHYSPKEIFKTKQYYLLFGGVFFTMPAYFILNPIFLSLGTERGLSAQLALIGVSLTGISSAAGRLAVAWISDKFGRKAAMIGIAVIILCASLLMILSQGILFLICIMLISFGFGGCASVYGAMTTDSFGTKYGGMNFGLVNIGFGAAALIFPMVSSRLASTGSYTSSFLLAAAASVVAIVLVLLMKNPE